MSARDELMAIMRDYHGEFCMSSSHDCDVEIAKQTADLYARIRNGD
ncbi:hypothetical protein ACFRLW_37275 [Streptomyces sp. NPDC056728]